MQPDAILLGALKFSFFYSQHAAYDIFTRLDPQRKTRDKKIIKKTKEEHGESKYAK